MKAWCLFKEGTAQELLSGPVVGGRFEFDIEEMREVLKVLDADRNTKNQLRNDSVHDFFREQLRAILETHDARRTRGVRVGRVPE